ncbi:RDD family protein [Streptomyces poriticola]|uniref:RDD family protein n=1 Tax=Streptomyces poriticola TaxID=3120506 RepID=UPI002FCE3CEE
MSAPTPAPGDDRPREGYYPDPSIPGYVRYWNGASWVPGTSRPAPAAGEQLAPPPGVRPARPSVEETGPHFFDEDPVDGPAAAAQHGSAPEPAEAWGGDQPRRAPWPAPQGSDPRVPHASTAGSANWPAAGAGATAPGPAMTDSAAEGRPGGTGAVAPGGGSAAPAEGRATDAGDAERWPAAGGRSPEPPAGSDDAEPGGGTFVFRRPAAGAGKAPAADEGTMTFRPVPPRAAEPKGPAADAPSGTANPPAAAASSGGPGSGPGFGAGKAAAARAAVAESGTATPAQAPAAAPTALSGPQQSPPSVPQQSSAPLTSGPGGGQSSWAQQVHRLAGAAGDGRPVAPWKPPVEDPFQAAARRQASARPAGLGRRLAARLLDTVVLAAVTAVAAIPLGTRALDHVNGKIDEARLSGETVTVWLLDGTTALYLGAVLAVLLLFGVVYEALPTAKWGRTLGKKLLGIQVRDIEGHEAPSFGAALRRWLVYSIPGLLVVGVVGVAWCLFDRPWHQCWHDKAAHTFVAA